MRRTLAAVELDLGTVTLLAIAGFALILVIANRFNARDIQRTTPDDDLALLRVELADVSREAAGRYRVREGGVVAYVTIFAREEVGHQLAVECDVPLGRLAAFDARDDDLAATLSRHGASGPALDEVDAARSQGIVRRVHISCDGRRLRLEASALSLFGSLVRLVIHVARSGARALVMLPGAWSLSVDSATRDLDGTPVTVRIDGGLCVCREGALVPREVRDASMQLEDAITRLAKHARGPELHALAEGLEGTLITSADRVALRIALGSPLEAIESAARLVARLEDPAPGDVPYR